MQSAVLHDPMRVSTPSMRLANAARIERQQKIASAARAVKQDPETKPYTPFWEQSVEETTIAPPESIQDWAERQKKIPLPAPKPEFKEPWFSIIDEIEPSEPLRPTVDLIVRTVAKRFALCRDDILSQRRTQVIIRPRMIAIYLAKTMTLRSLPDIGRRMAGRDHTTILHSVRKIQRLVDNFPDVAAQVDSLRNEIQQSLT